MRVNEKSIDVLNNLLLIYYIVMKITKKELLEKQIQNWGVLIASPASNIAKETNDFANVCFNVICKRWATVMIPYENEDWPMWSLVIHRVSKDIDITDYIKENTSIDHLTEYWLSKWAVAKLARSKVYTLWQLKMMTENKLLRKYSIWPVYAEEIQIAIECLNDWDIK